MPPLRILCVHGVGNHQTDIAWQATWTQAIRNGLARWDPAAAQAATVDFAMYDDRFEKAPLTVAGSAQAMAQLLGSGIFHGIGDLLFRRGRAKGRSSREGLRWTAGMVVQWAENSSLRRECRHLIEQRIVETDANVIFAHSLGSLITYDLLARYETGLEDVSLVTLGSQIGNPFVRSKLGGRIVMPHVRRWWHLYNRHDDVFTGQVRLPGESKFDQLETHFDIAGFADHDAGEYLNHPETVASVYAGLTKTPRARSLARARAPLAKVSRAPSRRALLVGINEYPNEADRLDGCVNDCFLISSLLQECEFEAEEIRTVFNDRATAQGIRDRLDWLMEDVAAGDQRVFYYSGHGAQVLNRGAADAADRDDECLVPYDFDWSPENAVLDDELHDLYSQLPFDTRFVMILDCCHSGGMTRDGGPRARGLSPPDDIRHRSLRWSAKEKMWKERKLDQPNKTLGKKPAYTGKQGTRRRLGRALDLRPEESDSKRTRVAYGHRGPYLPLILQACREDELAYEYRHGAVSHGAFTFALGQIIRDRRAKGKPITFQALYKAVHRKLARLEYDQEPSLVGPRVVRAADVPWA